jgi:ribonucleoside-diphosphate reductase alpha chain
MSRFIVEGKKSKESVKVYSLEALAWRELHGERPLPEHCVTSEQISPEDHIAVQAEAQKWIDSSISKSINVPSDISFERFQDIYTLAYKSGLKGCTTFRFNPEQFQGVLVKEQDLANTLYKFVLEDGSEIEVKGNEEIEYDGEIHTAANLFDAIKEGYYGKW